MTVATATTLVEAIGSGVTGLSPGEAVYGYAAEGGAYAEWIALDATKVAAKPASLSHEEASSLALVGQTAMQAVDAARIASGQTVLVHGAGGAVGSIVVSLAISLGATVIGTASPRDAVRLLSAGMSRLIKRGEPFGDLEEKVDAVIDTVGGELQIRSFDVLKPGGILVALSQPPPQDVAVRRRVTAIMLSTETSTAHLDALRSQIDAGVIVPRLGRRYALTEVARAWRDWAARGTEGKLVIDVHQMN
ncbi:NADP-dependent oxidoreductase [Sphingomonas sp. ZB1N12]|uniref:NADP-dependent oxidoreductase n=1 Tax=Sphingomonas arabinosi TaxID=3096160 RepID=UPI002FC71DDC